MLAEGAAHQVGKGVVEPDGGHDAEAQNDGGIVGHLGGAPDGNQGREREARVQGTESRDGDVGDAGVLVDDVPEAQNQNEQEDESLKEERVHKRHERHEHGEKDAHDLVGHLAVGTHEAEELPAAHARSESHQKCEPPTAQEDGGDVESDVERTAERTNEKVAVHK